jgi:site-specific recombinase XerD
VGTKPNQTSKKKKLPSNADSWREVTAAFENDLYLRNQSDATITTYGACLNVFSQFYLHHLEKPGPYVARLQEKDIAAFIDYLVYERRLAAATVNRYIAALRSFSKFLLVNGLNRKKLTSGLKTFRVRTKPEVPRLSGAEVRRLVTAIDLNKRNGYRNLAILQLFLQCGLRVGELVRLSRDDVTLHKTTGNVRVREDKGRGERMIPLNKAVRKALRQYLDNRGPVDGHEPLFISEQQNRIGVAAVQHMIKRCLCQAGREELSTQDLRHHFAAKFYARSKKLTATQQVLGHRDINTTARYAMPTDADIQGAIDGMDR